ncbi:transposase [Anaerosolibacter carboniphilus]|uniref:Transposase n=1 Tax=Anaerosolibacter carboniphilus TaxID=1417629 RepID=A0A841KJR9_9FIRM|nr:IS110 family transposase [Anaerosolibacter carboniphilus]MBB6214114.1 transposase [Anaerosolibacter carboniphilus]
MHPKLKQIYVGVDTHKRTHTAVIVNCFSEKLGEITFENTPPAYEELLKEVKKHTGKGMTPIFGLEDTGGSGRALAVYLLGKKKIVKKVDASLSSSERKNQSITHKTDSHDALCVARVLVSRLNELPNADPQDICWTLSMLVGRRSAIVKASTALKNQLHNYITHHYPSYKKFFSVFDSNSALAFWEHYPSPSKLKGVTVEILGELLRVHSSGFFSTKKAEEILSIIERDGDTSTELQDSRDFMVSTTVRQLRQNHEEIKRIELEIKNIMDRLGYKLETMIGIELVTAASLVAEIGDIHRFSNADKLAKYAGIAPVKYSSGDKDKSFRNRQGNRKLYALFHDLASRQVCCGRNKDKPVNAIFYDYYQKKMSEGKTQHQAIICIMRRLVNIIYGMMKNKTEYVHPTLSSKQTA